MRGEAERRQYINEIKRIRSELGMETYDENYLTSLSFDELERLYVRHEEYSVPLKVNKSNRIRMAMPAIILICLIILMLVLDPFKTEWSPLPGPGNATGAGGEGEQPDFTNIKACMCDANPAICEIECYCDPLCTNVTG